MNLEMKVNNLLFWLLSPAVVALGSVPLLVGHALFRLLFERFLTERTICSTSIAPGQIAR